MTAHETHEGFAKRWNGKEPFISVIHTINHQIYIDNGGMLLYTRVYNKLKPVMVAFEQLDEIQF